MSQEEIRPQRIFISYARSDFLAAERLRTALLDAKYEAYLDMHDILPGEPWQERLSGLISRADTVLFLMTLKSIASTMCDWEVNEAERLAKRIFPLVAADLEQTQIPPRLNRLNFVFIRPTDDFERALSTLTKALETDIQWLREHTRLGDLAGAWNSRQRPRELLLRGKALRDAEVWQLQKPARPQESSDLHQQFIAASQQFERQRSRTTFVILGLITALTLAGGLFSWQQKQAADNARAQTELTLEKGRAAASGTIVELLQRFKNSSGVSQQLLAAVLSGTLELLDNLKAGAGSRSGLEQTRALALIELSRLAREKGESRGAELDAANAVQILAGLIQADPLLPGLKEDLMTAYDRLGDAHLAAGQQQPARIAFVHALALAHVIVSRTLRSIDALRRLGTAYEKLARADLMALDHYNAARNFTASLAVRRELSLRRFNPSVAREIGVSREGLGEAALKGDRIETALAEFTAALEIATKLNERDPTLITHARDRTIRHMRVGEALERSGDQARARYHFELAVDFSKSLAISNPEVTEHLAEVIGGALRLSKLSGDEEPTSRIARLKEALAFVERQGVRHNSDVKIQIARALAMSQLGQMLSETNNVDEALSNLEEAIRVLEPLSTSGRIPAVDLVDIAPIYDLAARLLIKKAPSDKAQTAKALAFSEARLQTMISMGADNGERIAKALGDRSWYALFARQFALAVESVEIAERRYRGTGNEPPIWLVVNKLYALALMGEPQLAEGLMRCFSKKREEIEKTADGDIPLLAAAGLDTSNLSKIIRSRESERQ